jgi:hypothetical protein
MDDVTHHGFQVFEGKNKTQMKPTGSLKFFEIPGINGSLIIHEVVN